MSRHELNSWPSSNGWLEHPNDVHVSIYITELEVGGRNRANQLGCLGWFQNWGQFIRDYLKYYRFTLVYIVYHSVRACMSSTLKGRYFEIQENKKNVWNFLAADRFGRPCGWRCQWCPGGTLLGTSLCVVRETWWWRRMVMSHMGHWFTDIYCVDCAQMVW